MRSIGLASLSTLVLVAAVVRVLGPLLWPSGYVACIVLSGIAWSIAYALYFAAYLPHLTAPRADGKAG